MKRPIAHRRYCVAAAAALLAILSACSDSSGSRIPERLEVVSGDEQSVAAGGLPAPLVVGVLDARGKPLFGVQVTFTSSVAGDKVVPNPAATDGLGQASVQLTPGATEGTRTITAAVAGTPPVSFTLRAWIPVRTLDVISGPNQIGVRGEPLPKPLVLQLGDSAGNPLSGAAVVWKTGSGGKFNPATAVSNAQGLASTIWTLGPVDTKQCAEGDSQLGGARPGAGPGVYFCVSVFPPAEAAIRIQPGAQIVAAATRRPSTPPPPAAHVSTSSPSR